MKTSVLKTLQLMKEALPDLNLVLQTYLLLCPYANWCVQRFCQGGIYLFVNDGVNELSISWSILSITCSVRVEHLTLIGADRTEG